MRVIDKTNFHIKTFGVFVRSRTPEAYPDFISNSGSKYWFIDDDKTLVRESNHWGHKIVNCAWVLCLGQDLQCPKGRKNWITAKIAFADLSERDGAECLRSFRLRKKYKRRAKEIRQEVKIAA